jgi:hypothetical protein
MPTPSHDSTAKRAKQSPNSGVSPDERAKNNKEAQRETSAKPDKERSDWEGMTPKPEQGEDDVAAPGQLPETD